MISIKQELTSPKIPLLYQAIIINSTTKYYMYVFAKFAMTELGCQRIRVA